MKKDSFFQITSKDGETSIEIRGMSTIDVIVIWECVLHELVKTGPADERQELKQAIINSMDSVFNFDDDEKEMTEEDLAMKAVKSLLGMFKRFMEEEAEEQSEENSLEDLLKSINQTKNGRFS